jgi:hypothetical protein
MISMERTVATQSPHVMRRIAALKAILVGVVSFGCQMMEGSARGGRLRSKMTIKAVRKYHGRVRVAGSGGGVWV